MSVLNYKMKWGSTGYREERQDSPQETLEQGGSGCERTLYVNWRTRDQASRDFLGKTTLVDGEDGFYYPSREVPNYHPEYYMSPFYNNPDVQIPFLWADSLRHIGKFADSKNPKSDFIDSDGGAPGAFLESCMKVRYTSYPYFILTDDQMSTLGLLMGSGGKTYDESSLIRYVYGKLVSSPKYQTLPTTDTLAWGLDNSPMTTTLAQLMPEGELLLKWFNIPIRLYDRELVESNIGRTNDDVFGNDLSVQGTFPRGTLVFCPPDIEPITRATGEVYLNVSYRFKYYPKGANRFFRYNAPLSGNTVNGEIQGGPGFYWATRRYDFSGTNPKNAKAVPESQLDAVPINVNVLMFPFGDFRNLFRSRVTLTDTFWLQRSY